MYFNEHYSFLSQKLQGFILLYTKAYKKFRRKKFSINNRFLLYTYLYGWSRRLFICYMVGRGGWLCYVTAWGRSLDSASLLWSSGATIDELMYIDTHSLLPIPSMISCLLSKTQLPQM